MDKQQDNRAKVLYAVAPDAPEWVRSIAQTIGEESQEAHGAILLLCFDKEQTQHIEHVNMEDLLNAIGNLAMEVREKVPAELAEELISVALQKETEWEDAHDEE